MYIGIPYRNPDFIVYNKKAIALHTQGRQEEAIRIFNKAILLNPEDAYAYSNKGLALCNLGRNEEALIAYNKAITIEPDLSSPYQGKGYTLVKIGRNEEAFVCYIVAQRSCRDKLVVVTRP